MSLVKVIRKKCNKQYKRLRKLRKARDIASAAMKQKKQVWKLSRVKLHFDGRTDYNTTKNLALEIYERMPNYLINLRPKPPTKHVVAKK